MVSESKTHGSAWLEEAHGLPYSGFSVEICERESVEVGRPDRVLLLEL